MLLESTSYNRTKRESKKVDISQAVNELLAVPGKVRTAKVATAYIDIAALSIFLTYVENHADGRAGAEFELFIERNSAVRLCNELADKNADKVARKLFKSIKNEKFGAVRLRIYAVQIGPLFHSKAIYIETNSHHRAAVGSLNLTANGLEKNEEILVTSSEDLDRNTIRGRFIDDVERYISKPYFEEIGGKVTPISDILNNSLKSRDARSLRDILLGGVIWYERKEVEAFAFPLQLPDKLRKARAAIDQTPIPYLQSTLDASLPVLQLMGSEFEMESTERSRWRRRLCIPTCYGLWSPTEWREEIEAGHKERSRPRREHLQLLRERFQTDNLAIVNCIVSASREIWTALGKVDVDGLITNPPSDLEQRATKWVNRVSEKMSDPKYLEFLASGLSPVNVPDVWSGNPSDAGELEGSFLDSIRFELNRQRPRSLLAKRLSDDLVLGSIESDIELRNILISRATSLFLPTDSSEVLLGEGDDSGD